MLFDYETLKFIWWGLVGILLIGFAIADGMDLGVGTLLPFLGKTDEERRVIINSVGPHWDGNQVWLITAGGAIFAAWPLVYAAAFSGLYMALLLVLFALFFRPVGFDYRSKIDDTRWRKAWDWAIFASGTVPALVFGVAFGNLLQGIPFHLNEYFMPSYDKPFFWALIALLNPFALLAGVVSLAMLVSQGALWLQLRTEGVIHDRARAVVRYTIPVTLIAFVGAGFWIAYGIDGFRILSQPELGAKINPLGKEVVRETGAWLANYSTYPITKLAPVLGIVGLLGAWLLACVRHPGKAYIVHSLAMAGVIATAGVSMFPFVMPSSTVPNSGLTLWDAASSHLTLTIMLWAVILFLPIVLFYTAWCYRRMWGRITVAGIEQQKHSAY